MNNKEYRRGQQKAVELQWKYGITANLVVADSVLKQGYTRDELTDFGQGFMDFTERLLEDKR